MPIEEGFSKRRMYNIFRDDGRALIVAMDHGGTVDVYPALASPGPVLDEIVAGGADAVLTTFGIARSYFRHIKNAGLILRIDGGSSQLRGAQECSILFSLEDALATGADAVACMALPGSPYESRTLANVSRLAGECARWGLPLMVEVLPGGFGDSKQHVPENIRLGCRIAAELGADFIKTKYVGSVEEFKRVVAGCYRPILVLGGERMESERQVLKMVRDAIEAGASGVVMGRNIWQHPRPRAMVSALSQIIHGGASIEEALELITRA